MIECEHRQECHEQCTQAFKIQPRELAFLIQHNFPLPRLCPNCRHYGRVKQRNPFQLHGRQCACTGQRSSSGVYTNLAQHEHGDGPCPTQFQTAYAPDRPEIVYCESCYQAEVS